MAEMIVLYQLSKLVDPHTVPHLHGATGEYGIKHEFLFPWQLHVHDNQVGNDQDVNVRDHAENSVQNVGNLSRTAFVYLRREDVHTSPSR